MGKRAYGPPDPPPRKRARRRAYLGTARWQRVRRAVLSRDLFTCHWCGGVATQADHVLPDSHGGPGYDPFDMDNIVAACAKCNMARPADAYSSAYSRERGLHNRSAYSGRTTVLSEPGGALDAASSHLSPLTPPQVVGRQRRTTTSSGVASGRKQPPDKLTGDYSLRLDTGTA